MKDDSLTLFARSSFDYTLIQKQKDTVINSIFEITGKKFKLILKEYIPPEPEDKIEETVKESEKIRTITDVFMGKIVECKNLISETEEGEENEVQNVQNPASMQEQNS